MKVLQTQILLAPTLRVIQKLQTHKPKFLSSCYLSGGTALALHLGHRVSEDLDFFTPDSFNGLTYQQELEHMGSLTDITLEATSLNAFLDGVKLQFLYYPYRLLAPCTDWNGIRISGTIDIACTKLITVSQRGSKKDFIDIYMLLKDYSLEELFIKLDEKYARVKYNRLHILKSLTYFDNADREPMPRMIKLIEWAQVKQTILSKVKLFSLA